MLGQSTRGVTAFQTDINSNRLDLQTPQVDQTSQYAEDTITIADYILSRLVETGVTHIFGVPGNFNLSFLDYVAEHPRIEWVGNCNELNASYAADGYARVREGSPGVVLTTFGAGELSCTNGIAGAFSERVPVIHLVGVPSAGQHSGNPVLHSTPSDGRNDACNRIYQQITITQTILTSKFTAASEIDRVITECLVRARPVYIMLPSDIVKERIPATTLKTPLNLLPPENEPETEAHVLDEIVKLVEGATKGAEKGEVVVLVDVCAVRYHLKKEVEELVKKVRFPVFAAPMGMTAVDESYERYGGTYVGEISRPEVRERIENSKLVLHIGALKSDFNTGNFSYHLQQNRTIEFHSDHTQVQYAVYHGIGMKRLLPKLTARLQAAQEGVPLTPVPRFTPPIPKEDSSIITHAWLWPRMSTFFQSKDVIVAETGTTCFAMVDVPFPPGSTLLSQTLWASIGWSVGSTLGAAIAARERGSGHGRTILFVGDGSLQMAVQELSVMIKVGIKPIIFVLNNKGYTIERVMHGASRKYDDIADWSWTKLLETFGAVEGETSQSYTVHTKDELDSLLHDEAFARTERIQLVEVMMDQLDVPRVLKLFRTLAEMRVKAKYAPIVQGKSTA